MSNKPNDIKKKTYSFTNVDTAVGWFIFGCFAIGILISYADSSDYFGEFIIFMIVLIFSLMTVKFEVSYERKNSTKLKKMKGGSKCLIF